MGYDRVMKRHLLLTASLATAVFFSSSTSAEVEKFADLGDGKLDVYFRLKFTPADGWVQDRQATDQYGVAVYVQTGKTFGSAPALMYIRVEYNRNNATLDSFINVENGRWIADAKDAKIDKLPGEPRANGMPAFEVYHFFNPSLPQQAYEMMAYGEDTDKDHNAYFLMIALTGASQKVLDDAEKGYRSALRAH